MNTKFKILELLAEEERSISDLAESLKLSKATVLYHLETLTKEGLVKVSREEKVRNFIKKVLLRYPFLMVMSLRIL